MWVLSFSWVRCIWGMGRRRWMRLFFFGFFMFVCFMSVFRLIVWKRKVELVVWCFGCWWYGWVIDLSLRSFGLWLYFWREILLKWIVRRFFFFMWFFMWMDFYYCLFKLILSYSLIKNYLMIWLRGSWRMFVNKIWIFIVLLKILIL